MQKINQKIAFYSEHTSKTILEAQELELKKEAELKKKQIENLEEVAKKISDYSERINQETLKTQTLFKNPLIQEILPPDLKSTQEDDCLRQIEKHLLMIEKIEQEEVIDHLEAAIIALDKEVGSIESRAHYLDKLTDEKDPDIEQMEKLIFHQEQLIEKAQKTNELLNKK